MSTTTRSNARPETTEKVRVTVRLSVDLRDRLVRLAQADGRDLTGLVARALRRLVDDAEQTR